MFPVAAFDETPCERAPGIVDAASVRPFNTVVGVLPLPGKTHVLGASHIDECIPLTINVNLLPY